MKKFSRIVFLIYLLWVLSVVFLNLRGDIGFGHGLGDLYYLMTVILFTLLSVVFFLRIAKEKYDSRKLIYLFVFYLLIIIVFYCLKLTLLRGAEYPWNGRLFL